MTEPAPNPNGDPTVRLDGKSWPIPELVVRQFRKIRRDLIDVTEAINPQFAKVINPETGLEEVKLVESVGDRIMRLPVLTYDQLLKCVFVGLTRAHPTLTPEEFEDFLYTDLEMLAAFIVVRSQSQIFASPPSSALKAESESPDSGEAAAVSPTGTPS